MATLNIPDSTLSRIRIALNVERKEWSRCLSGDLDRPSPLDQQALLEIAEIDDCLAKLGSPVADRTASFKF